MDDARFAAHLAVEAGRILMDLRAHSGLEGSALGDAADRAANAYLMDTLRRVRPDDAILSEEECDTAARLSARRVWIIDPLDGTREYREGRADWAVHIGLSVDGVAETGAVALPALGVVYATDDAAVLPELPARPRMIVSRSRPPKDALDVAAKLDAELVEMGSAGAKAMAVLRGEADIYLHSGGQYQWDNCAPAAVAAAYGLHISRIDGSPLVYNGAETSLPDLLICRREWAAPVLAALK